MEESEKRRERLKAMRMEAEQAEASGSQGSSSLSSSLSNPLMDTSANPSALESTPPIPRFDYYTDPMSAFSGSKRRSKEINQTPPAYFSPRFSGSSPGSPFSSSHSGPRNADTFPIPAYQLQMNHSPDHRSNVTSTPISRSCSWRSPAEVATPFSGRGSPASIPGSWNQSGGRVGYGFPPGPSLVRGAGPSPNSGRSGVHRFVNSPSPSSGYGSSPSSGRSGGRGRGYQPFVSAREKPWRYYDKSMVEDPWRFLNPIVGTLVKKSVKSPDTLRSWLPNSISTKKSKVSEEVTDEFQSQSSLAECLALSFEDAVNE